jgi:hypothetical protein
MKIFFLALSLLMVPLITMAQLPATQIQNNIQFIEGGIGLGESAAIVAESNQWPVELLFSQRNGNKSEWVANVFLIVLDAQGNSVFSHQVKGPMILLKLKPGQYSIESTYESRKLINQVMVISGQHQKVEISWR